MISQFVINQWDPVGGGKQIPWNISLHKTYLTCQHGFIICYSFLLNQSDWDQTSGNINDSRLSPRCNTRVDRRPITSHLLMLWFQMSRMPKQRPFRAGESWLKWCFCIYIYKHIYTYVYIYIYTYIHYIHTYITFHSIPVQSSPVQSITFHDSTLRVSYLNTK